MRHHTTTRPVLDDDGKQIGFEQINVPYTPEEDAEADAAEAAWISAQQITAAKVIAAADRIAKDKRDMVTASTSPAEMASWSIKRAEALDWQSSQLAADAPSLATEAQVRGIALADLVAKVLEKGTLLSQLEAAIAGRCGSIQDAARAATTTAELEAIDLLTGWPV